MREGTRTDYEEDNENHLTSHAKEANHHLHPQLGSLSQSRLWWALGINLVFVFVEILGGLLTHSLALLADAGHMLADVAALGLALLVSHLATRPATPRRTFGLLRAEVLGAFVNGGTLVLIVGLIVWEAWKRFGHPQVIDGPVMLGVASLGLLANLGSAVILARGRKENLNIQGAFLHMVADTLGSIGAMVAGLVIWTTGWYPIDAIASVVIAILILWSLLGFLRHTMNILLEAVPEDISFMEVKKALEEMEHIEQVHDLHIWNITSGVSVLSSHIVLSSCCCDTSHWHECLEEARKMLEQRFGINHSTLQVEPSQNTCEPECQLVKEE
jgi:cobalt-zinc-cadmium efflux system protein